MKDIEVLIMQRYALGSFGTSESIANTKKIEKGSQVFQKNITRN